MRALIFFAVMTICAMQGAVVGGENTSTPPNIVFILADDLGWGDLHCYGRERMKSPRLDQLAAEGSLFTQFYVNASVCSPSRCAFLTGQYPARHRIHGHYISIHEKNAERGMSDYLDPGVLTLASLLKRAGYATGHFGKWHLGNTPDAPEPTAYGFDDVRAVGAREPAWPDWKQSAQEFWPRSTELFVDEAIRFIRANREGPFFVNLWTLLPHAPLNPTDEQMEPFDHLSFQHGIRHKNAETIYLASVADVDSQVGRLLDELDALGLRDNTLVLFSSDNGPEDTWITEAGHSGVGSAGPFRGRKRSLYEGGIRMPFIVRWPGQVPAGRVEETSVVAAVDFLPTISRLVGVQVPEDHELDGEDVSDILRGASRPRTTPLMWEWRYRIFGHVIHRSPVLAIREGDWKLLMNPDRSRVELYDIPRDPTQLNNCAGQYPQITERLMGRVLAWQKTLPVGPYHPDAGKASYPWPGND